MNACTHREETLWLDLFGELGPRESREWHEHLALCPACRKERAKLQGTVSRLRTESEAPRLNPVAARRMRESVLRRMRSGPDAPSPWWSWRPLRLAPVLAAVALVVIVLGWNRFFTPGFEPPMALKESSQDMEVIERMDLLREMDTIEKLVQAVDPPPGVGYRSRDEEDVNHA